DAPPPTTGAKVTLIMQTAPAAKELPQLFVSPKSALAETPDMLSGPLPVFWSATSCAGLVVPTNWASKVSLDGARLTTGPGGVPVPESGTLCGLPEALSVMVSVPVRDPMAEGANVT